MLEVRQSAITLGHAYVASHDLKSFLEKFKGHVLGVTAFGREFPAAQKAVCPFLTWVNMPVLDGGTVFEVWTSSTPAVYCSDSDIVSARNDELLYGYIEISQSEGQSLESSAFHAYSRLFSFIEQQDYPDLLRVWNYFPQINADENGLERYRSFNVGRHEAFVANGRIIGEGSVPAACALGTSGGSLTIYFLAGKQPGRAVENPRQTSAYNYPKLFGPRSPTFARATLVNLGRQQCFFISGTASIVGYETLHEGDVAKQTDETLLNIRTLLDQAGFTKGGDFNPGRLFLKVYLRHIEDFQAVRDKVLAEFGDRPHAIYLQSDICRAELLLEIEGVYFEDKQQ